MRILITPAIWIARALYAVLCLAPRRNKIVMLSRQSDVPSRDFLSLAEQLQRFDPTLEIVVRCRFIHTGLLARIAYSGEILAQMHHLATARACIVDGYIVPVSVLAHDRNLFVVQMWHALGAIKQFGYQSLGRPGGRSVEVAHAMRMHRNYDAVLCGGPGTVGAFAAAFDVEPDIVLPLGLPAVDELRRLTSERAMGGPAAPSVKRLERDNPRLLDGSKTVVLYAPTFRKHSETSYSEVMDAFASNRFTLVVKPHELEDADVSGDNVVDATGVAVVDLLPECDVVITDYSAVAFEALAVDKPVYFYVYDIDEYRESQGLNLDPLIELPAVSSTRIGDLVTKIVADRYPVDEIEAFAARYVPAKDRECTADIARLVLSHVAPH